MTICTTNEVFTLFVKAIIITGRKLKQSRGELKIKCQLINYVFLFGQKHTFYRSRLDFWLISSFLHENIISTETLPRISTLQCKYKHIASK